MDLQELLALLGDGNLGVSAILLVVTVMLWRKISDLEKKYEDCLKGNKANAERLQRLQNLVASAQRKNDGQELP